MKRIPSGGRRLRRLLKLFLSVVGIGTLVVALAVDLLVLAAAWKYAPGATRAGWLTDYAKVKRTIEESYPNLDWTLQKGELDLPRLDRETTARIQSAATQSDAERAMRQFVKAFGDGHLYLRRRDKPDWDIEKLKVDTLSRHTPPENACATLGYDGWLPSESPFDFTGIAPIERFSDANAFDAGVLTLDGGRVGIVRIGSFDEDDYARTCRDEWRRLRVTLATTCEDQCRVRFGMGIRNRLLLDFESRIRQLERSGVTLVVLDLTHNRGGYSWYSGVGEILAGKALPTPPVSFVRGRDTVAELESYMAQLDRSLAICPMPPARRRLLDRTYRRYDAARAEALTPCNRSGVWRDAGAKPVCSQLTSPIPYDSEALAGLDLHPNSDRTFWETFLEPVRYRQPRVVWHGRLAVLVDRRTGSAAELLAGLLQDYANATVIGEHSASAGAGWHRGNSPDTLNYLPLQLHVPDQVSYRRDGSNYRAGIEPDILTGWGPDQDAAERARWLVEALEQALRETGPNNAICQDQFQHKQIRNALTGNAETTPRR